MMILWQWWWKWWWWWWFDEYQWIDNDDDVDDDDNDDDDDVNGDGIASASGDEGPAFIPLDSPFVTQLLPPIRCPIFIIIMMRMKLEAHVDDEVHDDGCHGDARGGQCKSIVKAAISQSRLGNALLILVSPALLMMATTKFRSCCYCWEWWWW